MDLAFVPNIDVGLVAVVPETLPGHMPGYGRVVDLEMADAVARLADQVGMSRTPDEGARRLDVLVTEAEHRCGACDPAATERDRY